jgi:hypothetical protein
MSKPKDYIISLFGGGSNVANICGVSPSAVTGWEYIPAKHHQALYEYGLTMKPKIKLKLEHFFME